MTVREVVHPIITPILAKFLAASRYVNPDSSFGSLHYAACVGCDEGELAVYDIASFVHRVVSPQIHKEYGRFADYSPLPPRPETPPWICSASDWENRLFRVSFDSLAYPMNCGSSPDVDDLLLALPEPTTFWRVGRLVKLPTVEQLLIATCGNFGIAVYGYDDD